MASARLIVDELRACGITHVVALPDNTSKALLERLAGQPEIRVIGVTREGEAWAVAAGLWLGGGLPLVVMQNTGFLESGDALRGTAMRMRLPIPCLLTYRGYATLAKARRPDANDAAAPDALEVDAQTLSRPDVDSCALLFEPTLQAWGLAYDFLHDDADLAKVRTMLDLARQREHPTALLITRDTT